MAIVIEIEHDVFQIAYDDAVFRWKVNSRVGYDKRSKDESLLYGFQGALLEEVIARYFNIKRVSARMKLNDYRFWNFTLRRPDVGPFEVKSTRDRKKGLVLPVKMFFGKDGEWIGPPKGQIGLLGEIVRCPDYNTFVNWSGKAFVKLVGCFKLSKLGTMAAPTDLFWKFWDEKKLELVIPRSALSDKLIPTIAEKFNKFEEPFLWEYDDAGVGWQPSN